MHIYIYTYIQKNIYTYLHIYIRNRCIYRLVPSPGTTYEGVGGGGGDVNVHVKLQKQLMLRTRGVRWGGGGGGC